MPDGELALLGFIATSPWLPCQSLRMSPAVWKRPLPRVPTGARQCISPIYGIDGGSDEDRTCDRSHPARPGAVLARPRRRCGAEDRDAAQRQVFVGWNALQIL